MAIGHIYAMHTMQPKDQEKTVLDRDRTDCISLTHMTLILTFNTPQVKVMTYSHAKVQGQQSDSSKQTDGQMDGGDCITCRINIVGNN